ncbi:hypothetical protein KBTX_02572 [wastewater metagenome]|uniref:Uncharacterized protein n=2 Tax=unclassified sequences TaxID=12908 RepID=A0A5B8RFC9_9ZZZZ|nr:MULTISPECIES: hypothetical protein [Arhodomonas]MCS4503387.1 hypothetical protein [Arhodomonas aquaeolei]QEA06242.1 hypothetical protein KBTEX_02572 [uncultured organism]
MKRTVISALVTMALLAGVAGMSGLEGLDARIAQLRENWVAAQATPNEEVKEAKISRLNRETAKLVARFPDNETVLHWHRALVHAERHYMRGET